MRLPIAGYEGLYEVSDLGEVFALEKWSPMPSGGVRHRPEKKLLCSELRGGYIIAALYRNGVRKEITVHRLVCAAFHGPAVGERQDVNHKDGARSNNRASNLEWVTKSENVQHAFRVLRRKPSRIRPVVSLDRRTGALIKSYAMLEDVRADGFSPTNVSAAVHGRLKTSGGMRWQFAEPSP